MTKITLFAVSMVLTASAMLVVLYIHRPGPRPVSVLVSEGDNIYVSSQISVGDVDYMARRGMRTIVDLRPDGEAPDEPSHLQMEQLAKARGLGFSYIPVPHESIPATCVKSLSDALSSSQKPAVLYCRTGRRAVRTFALFEASRDGGPSMDAILAMAKRAGFSADDLQPEIATRIAARTSVSEAKP